MTDGERAALMFWVVVISMIVLLLMFGVLPVEDVTP
jgi:hypothetical protein